MNSDNDVGWFDAPGAPVQMDPPPAQERTGLKTDTVGPIFYIVGFALLGIVLSAVYCKRKCKDDERYASCESPAQQPSTGNAHRSGVYERREGTNRRPTTPTPHSQAPPLIEIQPSHQRDGAPPPSYQMAPETMNEPPKYEDCLR